MSTHLTLPILALASALAGSAITYSVIQSNLNGSRATITALKTQISEQDKAHQTALTDLRKDYEGRLAAANEKAATAQTASTQCTQTHSTLETQCSALEDRYNALIDTHADLVTKERSAREQLAATKGLLAANSQELELLRKEYEAHSVAYGVLEGTHISLLERTSSIEKELELAERNLTTTKSNYEVLLSEKEDWIVEREGYEAQVGALETRARAAEQQLTAANTNYATLLQANGAETEGLKAQLARYEAQTENLQSQIHDLKTNIELGMLEQTGVTYPFDIVQLRIPDQKSGIWTTIKEYYQKRGVDVSDQLCENGRSRDFGVVIYKHIQGIKQNDPQQPDAFQDRLKDLDLVFQGDRFNMYASKKLPTMSNSCG